MTTTVIYDGSFNGLLTAVFTIYDHKIKLPIIEPAFRAQQAIFGNTEKIETAPDKAQRVWKRFIAIVGKRDAHQVYKAFLSEIVGMENAIYDYLKMSFDRGNSPSGNYANATVLKISQASKMVGREKHRMEAFVRFHLIDNDLYYANIEPDFNLLPLISKHFKNRYADQRWIIYDLKRDYGIHYNLEKVLEVSIEFEMPMGKRGIMNTSPSNKAGLMDGSRFRESEINYKDLWNQYFKSTNITSRKNMKLHVQHVPKRYWKYLSEKL